MFFQIKDLSSDYIYRLSEGKNLIGRSRSAQMRLLYPDVSGKQCVVILQNGIVMLQNISRFGTRINGQNVSGISEIQDGDKIQIGNHCELILEACQDEPASDVDDTRTQIPETGAAENAGHPDKAPDAGKPPKKPTDETFNIPQQSDPAVDSQTLSENNLPPNLHPTVSGEETAATRFVSDLTSSGPTASGEETAATRFASDLTADHTDHSEDVTLSPNHEENSDGGMTLTMEGMPAVVPSEKKKSFWAKIRAFFSFGKKKDQAGLDDFSGEDIFNKDDKTIPQEDALGIMGNSELQTSANETASFPAGINDNAVAENLLDEISLEDGSSDETEKTSENSLNDTSLQTGVESAIPTEQSIGEADPEDAEKPLESEHRDTGDGSHPAEEAEKDADGKSGEDNKEKVSVSDTPDRLEYFEDAESQENKTNPDLDDEKNFFTDEENESAEKTNVDETLLLQTRMASVEEINYIKDQVRKKQQHRLFLRVSIFTAIAFALFCIWHLRAPQQEKELSWPTGKGGEKSISTATPFKLGWKKGGFDVYYPDCGKQTVVSGDSTSVCEIRSFIGKRKDVPLRIIITKQADRQGLEESRKQSFARLLTGKLQSKNEQFTFDRGGSEIFLGRNNGILCSCIYYQKDQNSRSFFGRLYYFKYGADSYCLTAEVPMEDKNRARNLLDENTFFDVSDKFVALHWEGTNDFIRGNLLVRIDEIEDDIRRKSPFQIASLEKGLQGVLIQATLDKNIKILERAVELLGKLRKNEDELYREKMGQWLLALATKNEMLKQKVRNDSEGIFSMETDRRRSLILKDSWECEK